MVEYSKPLPEITPDNKPFWSACKQHELSLHRCQNCGHIRLPSPICQKCLSMDSEWVRVSGRGKLYTWTTIYQRYHPGFAEELPYNVAIVELENGLRLMTNIVGCKNEDLRIGMEVEVIFEDVTEEITLPKFKPVS